MIRLASKPQVAVVTSLLQYPLVFVQRVLGLVFFLSLQLAFRFWRFITHRFRG